MNVRAKVASKIACALLLLGANVASAYCLANVHRGVRLFTQQLSETKPAQNLGRTTNVATPHLQRANRWRNTSWILAALGVILFIVNIRAWGREIEQSWTLRAVVADVPVGLLICLTLQALIIF